MFSLIYNEGGAMGTRLGPSAYYLAMAIIVLPLLLYYLYQNRHQAVLAWPLSFIAGGAIGNLIDRIRIGRVVDFLDVDFFDINFLGYRLERWWTFNIADSAITCAIIFMLIQMFFLQRYQPPPESSTSDSDLTG